MRETNAEWLESRGESVDDYIDRDESRLSECCEEPIDEHGFCTKCHEHGVPIKEEVLR